MNGSMSLKAFARGATAVTLMLAGAPDADAFDGVRRGFHLEVGVGGGPVPVERRIGEGWTEQTVVAQAAPTTRFRAGWGVGRHLLIQYVNDVWWSTTDFQGHINAFYMTGMNGLGATYLIHEAAPSAFVEAGIGIATADGSSTRRGSGLGVWGGLGYEPWKGWLARLTLGRDGAADDLKPVGSDPRHDTYVAGLTFSRVWY